MRRTPPGRTPLVLALLSALALVLAACGGDDAADTAEDTATEAAGDAESAAEEATSEAASEADSATEAESPTESEMATESEMESETATEADSAGGGTIVDVAQSAGSFSTLITAVQAADDGAGAGLAEALSGEGPFTVFAPTDDAFAALPEGALDALLANPDVLAQVLQYHVAEGETPASALSEGQEIATLYGQPLTVTALDPAVTVNDTEVVQADVSASNGIIHAIGGVLVPEDIDVQALIEQSAGGATETES